MDVESRTAERRIARIALGQHGNVTREQLLAAGLSCTEIARRREKGLLILQFRGVYRVGHAAPSLLATYMAAVLACGEGALLRGRAAAHLHRLLNRAPTCTEVLTTTERRVPGVRTTRSRAGIDPRDATKVRGIPVTTVSRTLVDIATDLPRQALSKACHEAGVRYRTTPREVSAVLARRPNAKGAAKLRAVMSGEEPVALSRLEARFLALMRAHDLPLPKTNKPAGGLRVDCRWPAHKLTVELDSYRFHNTRHAWESDRRRERQAYARGDAFRRFTWGDVFERPGAMIRELTALLASAGR
jgi:hypothetical protein